MYVLGISCYYHDSAACLLKDGKIVAAAEEERFSREKHDSTFPNNAVEYCLKKADIGINNVDYVGFYEKPIEKFDRILETFLTICPRGFSSFIQGLPTWITERLWTRSSIRNELGYEGDILFGGHHESHAASSFYASPFEEAAILTVDGVGEWNTTTYGIGENNTIEINKTIDFPHSIGLLYSAFTYYLGFKVNNGEYKVMGLSSYGDPSYTEKIYDSLIDVKKDGSFRLNMEYFDYLGKPRMTNDKFESLFGYSRREPETDIEDYHFDIAASIQKVTEELLLKLVEELYRTTDKENLCMAGGVALNSVANGRLIEESSFEDIFIQPAAGDDGAAFGVASSIYYQGLDKDRTTPETRKSYMQGSYLGPKYSEDQIVSAINSANVSVESYGSTESLLDKAASLLAENNVVGLYQGRMEWGPRALGNRSILADPRDDEMQDIVNRKIKFREGFRPFAPSVIADRAEDFFDIYQESPYMLFVYDVKEEKQGNLGATTHVDGTARLQTVHQDDNPMYYDLISKFGEITDVPVVLNTSMNRRGEPVVNTPQDAVECFTGTNMDHMVFPDAKIIIADDKVEE
jgi:carbamoyltransferase